MQGFGAVALLLQLVTLAVSIVTLGLLVSQEARTDASLVLERQNLRVAACAEPRSAVSTGQQVQHPELR